MFPYALHLQYIYIGLQIIGISKTTYKQLTWQVWSLALSISIAFFINSIFKQCSAIVIYLVDIKRQHERGVKTVD